MSSFEGTVRTQRPIDEVFAAITSIDDIPRYVPQVLRTEKISDGPVAVGTRFDQHGKFLGMNTVDRTTVTEFASPRHYAYEANTFPQYRASYDLVEEGGGTRIHYEVQMLVPWYYGPLGWLMGRMFRKAYAANSAALCRQLDEGAFFAG